MVVLVKESAGPDIDQANASDEEVPERKTRDLAEQRLESEHPSNVSLKRAVRLWQTTTPSAGSPPRTSATAITEPSP